MKSSICRRGAKCQSRAIEIGRHSHLFGGSDPCVFQRAMGSVCASNFSTNDVNRTALYCDNLKSTDFKSDAVLPIILSQTQHECCQYPFCVFAGIFKSEAL